MAKTSTPPQSFESAIEELENIVHEMEAGTISLEQALDRYQRGMVLLRQCQDTLQAAELRVRQIEVAPPAPPDIPNERKRKVE